MKTQIHITTLFLCITMLYSSIIFAQTQDSEYIEPLKISSYIHELKIDFESSLYEFVGYVLIKNTSDSIVYFTTAGGGCHVLPDGMVKYTEKGKPGLKLLPHDSSYYYVHGWYPTLLTRELYGYGDDYITRRYCSILDTMRNETIFARTSFCTNFRISYYNVDSCKYVYECKTLVMGLFLKKEYLVDYQFFHNNPPVKSYNDLIKKEDE